MNAMILAAGFGTRLLPHTKRIPKPLLPVVDKTLLEIAIETVLKADPAIIVINTHHLGGMVREFVRSLDVGVEIIVTREREILGTAGGIKNAQSWLEGDHFVVMNSDIIACVDWEELTLAHKQSKAISTLALRKSPDPEKYSHLSIDDTKKVVKFHKTCGPSYKGTEEALMFTGISVLSPEIFGLIPDGVEHDISSKIYTPMTEKGEGLYGVRTDWQWIDVGTCKLYHKVVMGELSKRRDSLYIEQNVKIGRWTELGPRVAVHSGAKIGSHVTLEDCVVLPNSVVDDEVKAKGQIF